MSDEHDEPLEDDDREVSEDAIQLTVIAVFNGLCRLIAALSENGLLTPGQLRDIHDAMTTPLDDEQFRDDESVTVTRTALEKVLAKALREARESFDKE